MSEKSALFMARTTRFHEFARSLTTTLGVEVSLATPDSPTAAHDFDLLILDSDGIRSDRRIFPSVIVAVAESQGKNGVGTTFMLDERVALAREALGDIDGVEVLPFTGLLVDFAREQGAGAVVKGLRAMTDFEYELQQADLNYRLDNELESIFVMSAPQYGYISSSVVRQIASLGSDVSNFVPSNVVKALKHRFS